MADPLLEISGLEVRYPGRALGVGTVDLQIHHNEVFGLVGESGSGKTTLGMAVLGSLPASATIIHGSIRFLGRNLITATPADWQRIRWRELAYIPQGALNSLNPVSRIGRQFADLVGDHTGDRLKGRWLRRVEEALAAVRLGPQVLDLYPHELSGGMKQRVCIAMAILFDPRLIVADEPTSALDVVSQRVVLQMLLKVRSHSGMSMLLIGHDLALQAQIADRIGILFAGQVRGDRSHPGHLRQSAPSLYAAADPVSSVHQIPHGNSRSPPFDRRGTAGWMGEDEPLIEVSPGHFLRRASEPV